MATTCVVCRVTNFGMISLYGHPNNLDNMLTFVTDHKVVTKDHLCITCYDELKIAYHFKQKYCNSHSCKVQDKKKIEDNTLEFTQIRMKFVSHNDDDKITTTTNANDDEDNQESTDEFIYGDGVNNPFADFVTSETEFKEDPEPDGGHNSNHPSLASGECRNDGDDEMDEDEEMDDKTGDEETGQEDGEDIKCNICDKTFTKKGNFQRHMNQVHGMGVKVERIPRDRHRRGPVPKYEDDDVFRNLSESQCEYCYKTLSTIEELREHESKHKAEERPYKCVQHDCVATFKDRYSVRNHVRIHTGEKRYKCRFCDQAFHQRGNLKAHERCHTGEKPFVCPHCGKGFAENGNLKSHIRFHTGERPYSCEFCEKRFRTHYSHKIHVRSHTQEKPFECDDCGKSFNCSGKLRIHRRIHTGIRPYKCGECGAGFMDSTRLKRHSKTHTD